MKKLQVEALSAGYGTKEVLHSISLDVDRGTTLGVLGPSGCGKTTLLLCLAGLLEPRSGRMLLDGADVTRRPPERRGIVLLHQENTLFPHLDVASNVAFGLRERRVAPGRRAERVQELLELVRLDGFGRRRVDELSGGERQRVALARALAVDPAVLLLDEPLSSLDRTLRVRLREELRRILKELEITSLFVTHDQEEAAWLGDELVLMDEGRILERGEPALLHRAPSTGAAAALLGRRNLLPYERTETGTLRTSIGDLAFEGPSPPRGVLLVREEGLDVQWGEDASGLEAEIVESRSMGSRTLVRLRIGAAELMAELAPGEAPSGPGPCRVRIAPGALHPMPT